VRVRGGGAARGQRATRRHGDRAQRDCPSQRCTLRACAASQTMAATEALRQLMSSGVAPDDMTGIRAVVLPPHLKMIDHGVVANGRASHLTSVQYQMALAAHRPHAVYDFRQLPSDLAPEMRSFMARIRVEGDGALLASYPAAWPGAPLGRDEVRHLRAERRPRSRRPGSPVRRATDHGQIPQRGRFLCLRTNRRTTRPGELSKAWMTANR
jgi:2-methylcitrate dehydratase PrpD